MPHPFLRVYNHTVQWQHLSQNLLSVPQLNSTQSTCPTAAPETTTPAPLGVACNTLDLPVAVLPTQATWAMAVDLDLPALVKWDLLSIIAVRKSAPNPSEFRALVGFLSRASLPASAPNPPHSAVPAGPLNPAVDPAAATPWAMDMEAPTLWAVVPLASNLRPVGALASLQ